MATPLPPVPPLTAAGFADPVWQRWLGGLRDYIRSTITEVVFTTVTGLTGTTVVGSNGQATVTLSTSVTGLVKGDGQSFLLAVAGTDYIQGLTAALPLAVTAGAVPALSMAAASAARSGYLLQADWTTFNSKLSGPVTWGSVTEKPITLPGLGVAAVDFSAGLSDSGHQWLVPVSGFAVTVGVGVSHVVLAPAATLASGSITLPTAAVDGLLLRIVSTAAVTTLTVTPGAGQTVVAAPTALAANVSVAWLYRLANTTWYRLQ